MNFNKHYDLEGKHAFLSASNYHWLGYSIEKVITVFQNAKAKERGTRLHEFASKAINERIKLEDYNSTLGMFVNDCIDEGMSSEVVLHYSPLAFGTADAISFDGEILKIYDLKTGKTPASMKQLYIYAAFFCLEYSVNPNDIEIHFRIYQDSKALMLDPEPDEVWDVMDKIIAFDDVLANL